VLGPEGVADEVDPQHGHEQLGVDVDNGPVVEHHFSLRGRCVVVQDVKSAELVDRGGDHGFDLGLIRDISTDPYGAQTSFAQLLRSHGRGIGVDVGNHHRRPLFCQHRRRTQADARR
jgi:hypothetical protein